MAFYQLKSLFTGESAGGNFTLTGATTFPTTIFVFGVGNVTFNSSGDLPYIFPGGYNVSAEFSGSAGGVYNIDYCVSGCTDPCSSTTLTIIEKPVIGTTPTITRCGVNGVYAPINVCYAGALTKHSDGTAYTAPLASFTWSKGAWSQTGTCVTIPGSVTAGTINLQAVTTTGSCTASSTVQLVDVNIFAGAPNAKSYCWDKVTYDSIKNLPAASNYNKDLTVLFNPVGQLVPPGTSDTWTFVSGPKVITMLTGKIAKFQDDVLEGTYVFKRTLQYGSCISEANFTIIIKFCSRGVLNVPLEKSCLLNTNVVMNTTYASSYPAGLNVLSNSGCWLFVGSLYGGDSTVDLEINGVPYTSYGVGCTFPYNSTVKITSVGKYDFVYTGSGGCPGGCAPCGCVSTNDAVSCGCPDGIITSSSFEGIFRINTIGAAPTVGSSQILALGCGTRKVSLYAKFNQLNGGGITAGGVWTYEGLTAPITIPVNGVPTTLNIGTVLSGSDPEIDLTGLPNPSNYSFKYTVTTTCGTGNKNLTVNITCNECNKVIDTTVVKTDCVSTLSIVKPVSFTPNMYSLEPANNTSDVIGRVLARVTDCDGVTTDTPVNARGNRLVHIMKVGNFITGSGQYPKGSYLKTLTLENNSGLVKTLNLDPNTTPYLSGPGGTALAVDLCYSHATRAAYATALKKVLRNAIAGEFGGALMGVNYDLKQLDVNTNLALNNGFVIIEFVAKHNPSVQWISLSMSSSATWSRGANACPSPNDHQTEFTIAKYELDSQIDWPASGSNYCGSFNKLITGYGVPGIINLGASTPFNLVLAITQTPVIDVASPQEVTSITCKKWNFATTVTPACSGPATYSYKVGGVTIPENTATFTKKTKASECNPFNTNLSQSLETTVGCDGCTGVTAYVKTTQTFC